MRVALVHDWLVALRGGEKVLKLLCELFPQAPVYTLLYVPGSVGPPVENRPIVTTALSRFPGVRWYYRSLLPLFPALARSIKLRGFDLVIAVSHCVAHGFARGNCKRFVAYYLTPMRYAWMPELYLSARSGSWGRFALRWGAFVFRGWDRRAARRIDQALCVSESVRRRIKLWYGRDALVVYPPVDTDFYRPLGLKRQDYYLWVGALAPYKRIDLTLEAFARLGKPLVVIGEGQGIRSAQRFAPPNVRFLGRLTDREVLQHYNTCKALVFPGEEDFGLVPVEAQACGCPVIAYGRGGAAETVIDLKEASEPTGVLFGEPNVEALCAAVLRFERARKRFDTEVLRRNALRFSTENCRNAFKSALGLREGFAAHRSA